MKKISFLTVLVSAVLLTSCGSKEKKIDGGLVNNPATANDEATSNGKLAKFEFEEMEYNFGEIIQGQVVEHVFKFKNTGDNDLLITKAQGSCGCTVPEYPNTPIAPGATSEIRVKFDSTGKHDHVEKTVTVYANTNPNVTTLKISGDVVERP